MNLIALVGKRKSGKTTVADTIFSLGEEMGVRIRKINLLSLAAEEYSRLTSIGIQHVNDFYPEVYTEFLRWVTECRKVDPYIMIRWMYDKLGNEENLIIDGLFTIEELAIINKAGGKVYKVECTNRGEWRGYRYTPGIDDNPQEEELTELSAETFAALGGGVIYNNRTRELLRKDLTDLVKKEYVNKNFILT